jgi:hypothetical protein
LTRQYGLAGLEVDHLNHEADQRQALRRLADRLGLLATGSSDYHGQGKRNFPLGAYTTSADVYGEIRRLASGLKRTSRPDDDQGDQA